MLLKNRAHFQERVRPGLQHPSLLAMESTNLGRRCPMHL